jgi:hypothetical protein
MTPRNYERADRPSRRCLVCGKFGKGCLNKTDGSGAKCSQKESDKPSRGGCVTTWYHDLRVDGFTPRPAPSPTPKVAEAERASIELLDPAYSKLIRDLLTLEETHARQLLARGLSRDEIGRAGYVSTPAPEKADSIARRLGDWIDVEGVPGFYRDGGAWRMVRTPRGILIPYRNEQGQIEGLQVRPDVPRGGAKYFWLSSRERERGAGPGSPVHFAHRHLIGRAREIVITEGGLKAHVCAHLSGQTVIGVPGVGNFGQDFAARLKRFAERVRSAVVAYDRDLIEKREVYAALLRLSGQLAAAGFDVTARTWPPPSKGYDDYLLSQIQSAEVQAA